MELYRIGPDKSDNNEGLIDIAFCLIDWKTLNDSCRSPGV
jgi:hypothetical protein